MGGLVLHLVGIVVGAVVFVAGIYVYLVPQVFPATSLFLIVGICAAAILGGCRIYLFTEAGSYRWLTVALGAAILAFCVFYISMFIILNTRGSCMLECNEGMVMSHQPFIHSIGNVVWLAILQVGNWKILIFGNGAASDYIFVGESNL
ncbi:hypothetical protein [Achromobacter sp. NCFB-sbj8-Ac1-l]|uniref:hypothetical protein n=1 Tax=unclassified Achromobacter TaxID=2626865 RepID=UPI004046FA3A